MRASPLVRKTTKSLLAREWKPRATPSTDTIPTSARHPERFVSQIILSDGSSFRVRSTAPRMQVKITKDTRSHALWNPQSERRIDDEGGYLSSFQKKFGGFGGQMMGFGEEDVKETGGFKNNNNNNKNKGKK
ncbi:hypothetical protein IWW50_000109 [Coemansia erecta]|nr:hypothetical protein GGF43_006858 [Coemansia sp. RSA 2618]KAJ2830707.1 hypothetical protein IWW50_000109 [Coemansia erecta]